MKLPARYLPPGLLLAILLAGMSVLAPAIRAGENHRDGQPKLLKQIPSGRPANLKLGEALDRAVLVTFYESAAGAHWKNRTNWLNERVHHCDGWYGVTCSDGPVRRVVVLNLPANQLKGEIPPDLGNLSRLQALNLAANQLGGGIPPELGRLSRLQALSLAANPLSGPIPPELGRLSQLEYLNLAGDQLSGNIPPELGLLSDLRALYLFANPLSGEIPPEVGNLAKLQYLYLFANQLSGDVPPELNHLSRLQILYLNDNRFVHLPEMNKLVNLEYLYLDNNPWQCFTEPQRRFVDGVRVHDIDPHLYPLCDKP